MIILEYYFDNNGGWLKYLQNNETIKVEFSNGYEIQQFINTNNLNITYKGCVDC
jgi:hypothetical protein